MKKLGDYSSTLRGVAAFCIDSWEFWRRSPINTDPESSEDGYEAGYRAGQMSAYAAIIKLATGRRIGTEKELCVEVAKVL